MSIFLWCLTVYTWNVAWNLVLLEVFVKTVNSLNIFPNFDHRYLTGCVIYPSDLSKTRFSLSKITFLKKDEHHYKACDIIIWKSLEKMFSQVNILLFKKHAADMWETSLYNRNLHKRGGNNLLERWKIVFFFKSPWFHICQTGKIIFQAQYVCRRSNLWLNFHF